ncbi:carboxypeptidase regulatory-like domain-containing protein [Coralloluteibacterium stylophorae]|uniref:Carboxypeptidase regulatory-like domain-containing protein n=2 Tax=Coralloluteibacterium stylophorae TaxID=1776034 RepID=A0AAP2G0C7_9GAMM|nr:carboxypeptidase regulatory-like domain-containing protein [Coralloluteibacterium stylophorae]MBS7457486.1 carboxypeptidase regulatory-like domain-containing protein [Coralloluteibacterium stylophorae]
MSGSLLAPTTVAVLLAVAVLAATLRLLRRARDAATPDAPRGARLVALLALQATAAALLWLVLFPPPGSRVAGRLTVLTARADAAGVEAADRVVALPEAGPDAAGERVPDLATALRRHPGTTSLRVVGQGLAARDRDAARGLALEFEPAPLPRGLVALATPDAVLAGARWTLRGRVEGVADAHLELRDPAGAVVARATAGADGGFALDAIARQPGRLSFALRVLDADGAAVEDVAVPVAARAGAAPRLLLLAGAPGAELKYLRRWAADAGLRVQNRMRLGRILAMGTGSGGLDPEALAALDLLVLDERAWRGLDANERRALADALEQGLGVLLRITGALDAADRAALAELGFEVREDPAADAGVRLPGASETAEAGAAASAPLFSRRPLAVTAADAVPLLRDDAGRPLALWRARGRGRLALWWLDDSYRMALGGDAAGFGSLWSRVVGTLARGGEIQPPVLRDGGRVGERTTLCGVAADASVRAPGAEPQPLVVDPRAGRGCAAVWPRSAGWHEARSADAALAFHVRPADEAPGLAAAQDGEATRRLAAAAVGTDGARVAAPGSPWPFFIGWLVASALAWWLERRRRPARG